VNISDLLNSMTGGGQESRNDQKGWIIASINFPFTPDPYKKNLNCLL
jgi:hypothetical protein